ncbi:MAG TPA: hypothetical protein VG737_09530 [Cyclobacteriaceae bacterium]|nr:hypothetical protein [Cyclobacteriaceae bacterium]
MPGKELVFKGIGEMYLFKRVVFNCRRATLLSLKKEQSAISLLERVELSYHLLYCSPCRRFLAQSARLRSMTLNLKEVPDSLPFSLSDESKSRITRALNEVRG